MTLFKINAAVIRIYYFKIGAAFLHFEFLAPLNGGFLSETVKAKQQ
jgi:hypothetical protein